MSKLLDGNVAFNAPESARVGKSLLIEAKLSVAMTANDLLAAISEPGRKESAALRVADKMSAALNGGGAFDISPSGPQVQLISRREITTWTWTVTPKQTGSQFLILSFDALVSIDGNEAPRNINTLKRKVEVEVSWPETAEEWLEYSKHLFDNLNWLWASILFPAGAFVIHRWRKTRQPVDGTLSD